MLFATTDYKKESPDLAGVYYSLILGLVLNLSLWFEWGIPASNSHIVCSRFFQNCEGWLLFADLPVSWNNRIFHFVLFLFIVASVNFFQKEKFRKSAAFLLPPLFLEGLVGLILFEQSSIPFISYNFFPCLIFIFSKNPISDLKWTLALMYVLSGWVKLDEGWLAGNYFHTLSLGLPGFPSLLITPVSILVTIMELSAGLLLLKQGKIQKIYLYFFYIFHLYSFIIVGYHYPLLCLPILYFTFKCKDDVNFPTKTFMTTAAVLLVFNLLPHFTDPDYKLTDQGNSLALNMFDANRQSFSRMVIHKDNGEKEEFKKGTSNAYDRVKPYVLWFKGKKLCGTGIQKISWEFEVSLNGGPFWKVVDIEDLCNVSFKPLGTNEWISPILTEKPLPKANSYLRGPYYPGFDHNKKVDMGLFEFFQKYTPVIRGFGIIFSLLLLILMARLQLRSAEKK